MCSYTRHLGIWLVKSAAGKIHQIAAEKNYDVRFHRSWIPPGVAVTLASRDCRCTATYDDEWAALVFDGVLLPKP